MSAQIIHKLLNYAIALVWFMNGFFCKVLNLVPRHQQIVSSILGTEFAVPFTKLIGCLEIAMAVWILSGIKTRLNAIAQIITILIMNTLEFLFVPNLLLWGKANSLFAVLFCILIWYNEFVLNKTPSQQTRYV